MRKKGEWLADGDSDESIADLALGAPRGPDPATIGNEIWRAAKVPRESLLSWVNEKHRGTLQASIEKCLPVGTKTLDGPLVDVLLELRSGKLPKWYSEETIPTMAWFASYGLALALDMDARRQGDRERRWCCSRTLVTVGTNGYRSDTLICRSHRCPRCAAAKVQEWRENIALQVYVDVENRDNYVLATITADPSMWPSRAVAALRMCDSKGMFDKLRRVLKKRFPGLEYIRAAEEQENGWLHLHLLIRSADLRKVVKTRAFQKWWRDGLAKSGFIRADGEASQTRIHPIKAEKAAAEIAKLRQHPRSLPRGLHRFSASDRSQASDESEASEGFFSMFNREEIKEYRDELSKAKKANDLAKAIELQVSPLGKRVAALDQVRCRRRRRERQNPEVGERIKLPEGTERARAAALPSIGEVQDRIILYSSLSTLLSDRREALDAIEDPQGWSRPTHASINDRLNEVGSAFFLPELIFYFGEPAEVEADAA